MKISLSLSLQDGDSVYVSLKLFITCYLLLRDSIFRRGNIDVNHLLRVGKLIANEKYCQNDIILVEQSSYFFDKMAR